MQEVEVPHVERPAGMLLDLPQYGVHTNERVVVTLHDILGSQIVDLSRNWTGQGRPQGQQKNQIK